MKKRAGWRRVALAACVATTAWGCKGEKVVEADPEVAHNLEQCEKNLQEKVAFINTQNERITELETGAGSGEPIVVTIEGEVMSITAGKERGPNTSSGDERGNAKDAELYEAFVAELKRSRGAIKKCYQSALKKNSALSARSVSLAISVNYRTNGKVKSARFDPKVSDQFDQCMDGVASNWTLPAMPKAVSFTYKQTLTPE